MSIHAIIPDSTITGFLGERNTKNITAPDGTFFTDLDAVSDAEKAAAGLYRVVFEDAGEQTSPYVRYTRDVTSHTINADTVTRTRTNVYPALDELKRTLVDELLNEADRAYPRVSLVVTHMEAALLVDEIREANRQGNPQPSNYPLINDLVGRVNGATDFDSAITFATQFTQDYKADLAVVRRVLLDRRRNVLDATTARDAIDARLGV